MDRLAHLTYSLSFSRRAVPLQATVPIRVILSSILINNLINHISNCVNYTGFWGFGVLGFWGFGFRV